MAYPIAKSKGKREENFRSVFPRIHEDAVRAALEHVAFGELLSVKDLAREIGCESTTTIYDKIHEPRRLSVMEAFEIVRLTVSRGDLSLIDLMMPDSHMVVAAPDATDAALDEEIAEEIEEIGECRRDLAMGRKDKALREAMLAESTARKIVRTVQGGGAKKGKAK